MTKYVYDFSEGNKDMKDLLGGKGANLAEMTTMGLPVPPGFTITTEACLAFLAQGGAPPEMLEEAGVHLATLQEAMGRELGDPDDPLLVSVRERRQVLDAGDDGHGPEPRAERPLRGGPREAVRGRRPLRARRLPPVHPDVRQDRDGRARRGLRGGPGPREGTEGAGHAGHRPRRRGPHGADRGVPPDLPRARGGGLPAGSEGAAAPRDRGRVPVVERQAGHRLPTPEQDLRRPRDRGERPGDGVRQPG